MSWRLVLLLMKHFRLIMPLFKTSDLGTWCEAFGWSQSFIKFNFLLVTLAFKTLSAQCAAIGRLGFNLVLVTKLTGLFTRHSWYHGIYWTLDIVNDLAYPSRPILPYLSFNSWTDWKFHLGKDWPSGEDGGRTSESRRPQRQGLRLQPDPRRGGYKSSCRPATCLSQVLLFHV